MSYYPVISGSDYQAVYNRWAHMFDSSVTMEATSWTYVMDNYYSPWINDFKVSKTLAGVQAFIDNDRTYIGAVHRVVMDSSNNGIYVIMQGNDGLEYRKIASNQASLIQNPTVSFAEAQNGFFSSVGSNTEGNYPWPIDGPFIFERMMFYDSMKTRYSSGRWPIECFTAVVTYDDAVKLCSPEALHDDAATYGYVYNRWPGSYITVTGDSDTSKNGLYVVMGNTYPEMRLVKLAFDPVNPTVSQTITLAEAENEYWTLFPSANRAAHRKGAYDWDQRSEPLAIHHSYYPCEGFTVFKRLEEAQVWFFDNSLSGTGYFTQIMHLDPSYDVTYEPQPAFNCYPGKVFSVIDDPDSSKNGLYMVTATITYYTSEYGTDYQRIENYGFIKMQTE